MLLSTTTNANANATTTNATDAPTIRLVSGKPSAAGTSSASSITNLTIDAAWGPPPTPVPAPSIPLPPTRIPVPVAATSHLAPSTSANTRKKLVPKKSKLNMLVGSVSSRLTAPHGAETSKDRSRDLSDVVRRVGARADSARKGGFEIYVDPAVVDDEVGEVLVVKKKKSRVALDGMRWGTLGEVTNVPSVTKEKEKDKGKAKEKEKSDEGKEKEGSKWWTIGRGRKDSKEKDKEKAPEDPYPRSKSTYIPSRVAYECKANERRVTTAPEPFKTNAESQASRARFNSLDAGIFLSKPKPKPEPDPEPEPKHQPDAAAAAAAPTPAPAPTPTGNQGSIALRAMRSVRSLARIGSWAQLRGGSVSEEFGAKEEKAKTKLKVKAKSKLKEGEEETENKKKVKVKVKSKENGDGEEVEKKKKKKSKKATEDGATEEGGVKKKKTKKKDKDKDKDKDTLDPTTTPARLSTSSFEIGSPTPLPKEKTQPQTQTLGKKKQSILGLGLPSSMSMGMTMRLQSKRSTSSTSASSVTGIIPPVPALPANVNVNANPDPTRLSVDAAHILTSGAPGPRPRPPRDRSGSVLSTLTTASSASNQSLRPDSIVSVSSGAEAASQISRASKSSRASSGSSVRWDEEGLRDGREARRRERAERAERERERGGGGGGEPARKGGRVSIADVFPMFAHAPASAPGDAQEPVHPPTADGHRDPDESVVDSGYELSLPRVDADDEDDDAPIETPIKRARPRPLSEQLMGKSRPRPLYEGEDGVLSILDAATNDLAQLINHLDLEATPSSASATPTLTPLGFGSLSLLAKGKSSKLGNERKGGSPRDESPTRNRTRSAGGSKDSSLDVLAKNTTSISTTTSSSTTTTSSTAACVASSSTAGPSTTTFKPPATYTIPTFTVAGSLRPYAQSRKNMPQSQPLLNMGMGLGRQIAPWQTLRSPPRESPPPTPTPTQAQTQSPLESTPLGKGTVRASSRQGQQGTPGPEPEPSPVFHPLRPAKSRGALAALRAAFEPPVPVPSVPAPAHEFGKTLRAKLRSKSNLIGLGLGLGEDDESTKTPTATVRAPSVRTFGSVSSASSASTARVTPRQSVLDASFTSEPISVSTSMLGPVFRRAVPEPGPGLVAMDVDADKDNDTVPIPPGARRILGMGGTMGGSDVSAYGDSYVASVDAEEDSDIPDELQAVLGLVGRGRGRGGVEDEGYAMSFSREAEQEEEEYMDADEDDRPELSLPLPTFHAQLMDDTEHPVDIDVDVDADADPDAMDSTGSSDDDYNNTKKSFDFTGEILKLASLNRMNGRIHGLDDAEAAAAAEEDRQSFVEQLENAFRTPAKVDLKYAFPTFEPPVPTVPAEYRGAALESEPESECEHEVDGAQDVVMSDSASEIDVDNSPSASKSLRSAPSSGSRPSDGQLNTAFKFGGLPKPKASAIQQEVSPPPVKPQTLSDIIPPLSHVRSLSNASRVLDEDEVLQSILAEAVDVHALLPLPELVPRPRPRVRLNSDSSVRSRRRSRASGMFQYRHSRHSSGVSFAGFDSFDEVRRGFEFSGDQSFYPPASATTSGARRGYVSRQPPEARFSMMSFASVSSYGKAHDYGLQDPFDYGLPSLRERPSSEEYSDIDMSMSVEDTFSFLDHQPRRRVASDASSFYFRAPAPAPGLAPAFVPGPSAPPSSFNFNQRRESGISVASPSFNFAPPVSFFNRSFGARPRNDSTSSVQSMVLSYAANGASGGRAAWARHQRQEPSVDSVNSDFSVMRLGRPGIGDKMFDRTSDSFDRSFLGRPGLGDKMFDRMSESFDRSFSAMVSPRESVVDPDEHRYSGRGRIDNSDHRSSFDFDSILDGERPVSEIVEDSLFDRTEERTASSTSDTAFFGAADDHSQVLRHGLPVPPKYRPLSVLSLEVPPSPPREDDTMISMLGGGHVRRKSVDASPCPRIEKRKYSAVDRGFNAPKEHRETPSKARIVEKLSIASTSSSLTLSGERIAKARIVEKPSIASTSSSSTLNAERMVKARIVEKPSIASTSSSSTFGGERMIKARRGLLDQQEDSCLVADGEDIHNSLQNVTVFSRPAPATRSRSSTCTSMSSGVDTPPLSSSDGSSSVDDEGSQSSIDLSQINLALANSLPTLARHKVRARARGHRKRASYMRASRASVYETIEEEMLNSPSPRKGVPSQESASTAYQPVFIVEPETAEVNPAQIWDDESGIIALRRYYALKDEAQHTVVESQRVWRDTPFSVFALQSFEPPRNPAGMQALLEHSVKNFGPLPSELRPRRVRSRTSSRPSPYPQARLSRVISSPPEEAQPVKPTFAPAPPVLQEVTANKNIVSTAPYFGALKVFSPPPIDVEPKQENAFGLTGQARTRVGSNARRNALGLAKRGTGTGSTKQSVDLKENVGQGTITAGDSLRINRPRPRGRPTPASTARPIRV
ncbi:hypothetical protein H0H92_012482 [Tricholoma furcatifolium]|nr:hypothetical protein H0H92_012482 [Tricholoma furcatifolium]